jgi:hypothetical protein
MTRDAETGNVVAHHHLAVLLAASARFEVTRRAPTQKKAVRLTNVSSGIDHARRGDRNACIAAAAERQGSVKPTRGYMRWPSG